MRRRGSILVVVLFMLTVLGLLALSLTYRAGLTLRSSRQDAVLTQLKAQAASAVAIALGRLAENTNDYDHFAEPWHTHAPLENESWLTDWSPPPGEPPTAFTADYTVIDEEGKLNLQLASSSALEALGMKSEQIAALLDWMDEDNVARADGAEHDYYAGLVHAYRSKNAPLEVLDELLLIRGFFAADYFGEDANRNRNLDANENDGALSDPVDDADGQLQLGWVDLLTTLGDGRININTAPRQVLALLPISAQAVDQIIGYRSYDEGSSGVLDDHVFRSDTDIAQLQGLSEADRAALMGYVAFRSRHFRIFATARHLTLGLRYDLQVLVRLDDEGPRVMQWKVGRP